MIRPEIRKAERQHGPDRKGGRGFDGRQAARHIADMGLPVAKDRARLDLSEAKAVKGGAEFIGGHGSPLNLFPPKVGVGAKRDRHRVAGLAVNPGDFKVRAIGKVGFIFKAVSKALRIKAGLQVLGAEGNQFGASFVGKCGAGHGAGHLLSPVLGAIPVAHELNIRFPYVGRNRENTIIVSRNVSGETSANHNEGQ